MCWKLKLTVRKFQRFLCSEAILGNSELASPKTCPTALFSKIFNIKMGRLSRKKHTKIELQIPESKTNHVISRGKTNHHSRLIPSQECPNPHLTAARWCGPSTTGASSIETAEDEEFISQPRQGRRPQGDGISRWSRVNWACLAR